MPRQGGLAGAGGAADEDHTSMFAYRYTFQVIVDDREWLELEIPSIKQSNSVKKLAAYQGGGCLLDN